MKRKKKERMTIALTLEFDLKKDDNSENLTRAVKQHLQWVLDLSLDRMSSNYDRHDFSITTRTSA
jgi:hypothetical protein